MVKKILVIEDDLMTRQLLKMIFTSAEYEVEAVNNGFAGLKAIRASPPDLVVLDLMLPGIDGFEILNQIRHQPATAALPVVIVSAKTREEDRELGLRLGASAYIKKPYPPKELLQVVGDLLASAAANAPAAANMIALVGPRATDTTNVIAHLSVILAQQGHSITLVDPRAFSLEHPLLLGLEPPSTPLIAAELAAATASGQQHPSGACLYSNLEGQGDLGQLTQSDLEDVLISARSHAELVLVDMRLQPQEYWKTLATLNARILIVAPANQAFLPGVRSILTLLQRLEIPENRLGFVLIGETQADAVAGLGLPILGRLPETTLTDTAALMQLTEQVLAWAKN